MGVLSDLADKLDPKIDEGGHGWYCWNRDCDGMPHEGMPTRHARGPQHPPEGHWFIWLIRAGRGFGKTRTGAEWLVDNMDKSPDSYWGVVAPTFDDGRDICIEGESGVEYVLNQRKILYDWNRSLGHLTLRNNARLDLFTGEKPDSLRGPNLRGAWGDEPATWRRGPDVGGQPGVWSNLLLMCRKGNPQIVLTGTPRPSKFVKQLIEEADHVTTGSSLDNRANLAESWFKQVIEPKMHTRIGRQEVYGEVLDDIEGALWKLAQIDAGRLIVPTDMQRLVIGVDPTGSAEDSTTADECGIVLGGQCYDHAWILGDYSLRAAPHRWAQTVVDLYRDRKADYVVAERNYGGEMVRTTIHGVDPRVPVRLVDASRGKRVRAEPVAALYGDPDRVETWEHGKVHHSLTADLSMLEDQMVTWVPDAGMASPDRMDSAVWLITDLLLQTGRGGLSA